MTHYQSCNWSKSDCEFKKTHNYCPHIDHTCDCKYLADRGVWTFSANEEWWGGDSEFETKEEAIEAGKKDKDCIERGSFFVGKIKIINAQFLLDNIILFDVESFNESMAENAGGDEDFIDENDKNLDELNQIIASFIINKIGGNLS